MDFTAEDLKWTKNVTRDKGKALAYSEFQVGDTFYLNYPIGKNRMGIASAKKPQANDLILLVQSINSRSIGKPGTYLSHIVATVDDTVIIDEAGAHPVKRLVTVVACDAPWVSKPEYLNFQEPNRGWTCDIDLIKPSKRTDLVLSVRGKQELLLSLFKEKDLGIKKITTVIEDPSEDLENTAIEGEEKYLLKKHKYYERDQRIIRRKKEEAESFGTLACDVCSLNFSDLYGTHGKGFIECHHRFPIAKHGKRTTTLDDLALVCANCHRMLHRKNTEGGYYTIEELKSLMTILRSNIASV